MLCLRLSSADVGVFVSFLSQLLAIELANQSRALPQEPAPDAAEKPVSSIFS